MRHIPWILLSLVLTLLPSIDSRGSWGPRGCSAAEPVGSQVKQGWYRISGTQQSGYYFNGEQTGWYDAARDVYRSYDAKTQAWGAEEYPPWKVIGKPAKAVEPAKAAAPVAEPAPAPKPTPVPSSEIAADDKCPCPKGCPCHGSGIKCYCQQVGSLESDIMQPWQLGGVDRSKISKVETITFNGREITKDAALELVARNGGASDIPDDAGKMRFTVIGTPAERQLVMRDFREHKAFAGLREKIIAADYPPEHWHVSKAGFFTAGHPSIYLQLSDGQVALRRDSYDGPEDLAGAVRKADPNYDPNKDPDGKPKPPPVDPVLPAVADIGETEVVFGAMALAVGGLFLFHRKQQGA